MSLVMLVFGGGIPSNKVDFVPRIVLNLLRIYTDLLFTSTKSLVIYKKDTWKICAIFEGYVLLSGEIIGDAASDVSVETSPGNFIGII